MKFRKKPVVIEAVYADLSAKALIQRMHVERLDDVRAQTILCHTCKHWRAPGEAKWCRACPPEPRL